MLFVYVRTYNVMSQLSDWKRAHMCTDTCTYSSTMVLIMLSIYMVLEYHSGTMVHVYVLVHVYRYVPCAELSTECVGDLLCVFATSANFVSQTRCIITKITG